MHWAIVITSRTTVVAAMAAALHGVASLVAVCDTTVAMLMLRRAHDAILVLDIEELDAEVVSFLQGLRARHRSNPVLLVVPPKFDASVLAFVMAARVRGVMTKPVDVAVACARIRELVDEHGGMRGGMAVSGRAGKALNYIAAHVSERLTIDGIARAIGTSRSRLAHLFQSELSTTVARVVVGVRIEVVKFLLLTTEEKLECIAETTGFYDASHLSRVLRRVTGVRPSGYRRRPGAE